MTIIDVRPENSIEFDIGNPPRPAPQEITRGEPVYLIPDNPWESWTHRTTGTAMGSWLAATVTYLLHPHLLGWALAAAIAATLLFAWVIGGRDLYDRHPK